MAEFFRGSPAGPPGKSGLAEPAGEPISTGRLTAAAVAGWVCPGAGHFLLGMRARGLILALTIMGLWTLGVLIAGASVVNPRQDSEWFLRQVGHRLMAPSVVLGWIDAATGMDPLGPDPDAPLPAYLPSFGRVREQGLLFTGLAGYLNLLVIVDLIFADPRRHRRRRALDSGTASPEQADPPAHPPADDAAPPASPHGAA